jgi:hypothetical protein
MFGKVIVSVVRSNILRDTCNCLLIRKHANASITLREQCQFNYERHNMVVNKKRNLNSSHILLYETATEAFQEFDFYHFS